MSTQQSTQSSLSDIFQFVEENSLKMEVVERESFAGTPKAFCVYLNSCKILWQGLYISCLGNGRTKDEAIRDLANKLQLQHLIIDPYLPTRRELKVPMFNLHINNRFTS